MVSNQVLLCSIVFKFVAMFIGVCGNVAVIILARTSKFWSKEKRETSYLVANLALADLLTCLTFYPTWIVEFTLTILNIKSDQVLFCKFNRSLTFSLLFASVASLLAITVDRYIYIVKPLKYPLIVTRRRVFAGIFALWLTACCIFAVWYFHFEISDIRLRSAFFFPDGMYYPLKTFQTYIPVSVIIVLNWWILLVSRKQRKKILAQTLPALDNNDNKDHRNEKSGVKLVVRFFFGLKVAKTFSIVLAILTLCILLPTLLGTILEYSCSNSCLRAFNLIYRYDFYGINSVVNAFIYGMRHVKYRKALRKLLIKVTTRFKLSN